jgi:hypothetical protein
LTLVEVMPVILQIGGERLVLALLKLNVESGS